MRITLLLSFIALTSCTAEPNETSTTAPTSVSPESGADPSVAPPSARILRGTVYHIRPVNVHTHQHPFGDAVPDFQFPALSLKSEQRDSEPSPSRSNTKVLTLDDSEAVEAVDLPKFIFSPGSSEEDVEPRVRSNAGKDKRDKKRKSVPPPHLPLADAPSVPKDASYAFGYTLEDQTRHEVADPSGNVNGYYQYVDDEGYVRKVVYTAGPGKGFVVLNKERVKGPNPPPKKPNQQNQNDVPDSDASPPSTNNARPPKFPASPDSADFEYPPGSQQSKKNNRRPIFVVKIRKPQDREILEYKEVRSVPRSEPLVLELPTPVEYTPPNRKSHRSSSLVQSPLVFIAGAGEDDGSYKGDNNGSGSAEDNGQWDGDIGNGPVYTFTQRGSNKNSQPRPDGSYSFGYETETANRLERADNAGNVRGSYSYVDSNGIKRTVHYIAGATTGFQVLGTSPSSARSVRIEAPPGFVVTRRHAHNSAPPTLAVAGSEYRSYPTAVVYHIHPDTNNFNFPWWDGVSRKPRKMRKVMRIHRKKQRYPKKVEKEESELNENRFSPTPVVAIDEPIFIRNGNNGNINHQNENTNYPEVPLPFPPSPSALPRPVSPSYVFHTHSEPRPFRHSTRVQLDEANTKTFFVRRRPSHRAYTTHNLNSNVQLGDSYETEDLESLRNDPILFSPTYEALSERQRPIPNPILLQPSRVLIKNRGAPFEVVAESNLFPVRSSSEPTNLSSREVSTSKSMQLSISSSTTRVPLTLVNGSEADSSNSVSISSSSIVQHQSQEQHPQEFGLRSTTITSNLVLDSPSSVTEQSPNGSSSTLLTTKRSSRRRSHKSKSTTTPSPTVVRMTREETAKSNIEDNHEDTMSSSTRLMQRLGVHGGADSPVDLIS